MSTRAAQELASSATVESVSWSVGASVEDTEPRAGLERAGLRIAGRLKKKISKNSRGTAIDCLLWLYSFDNIDDDGILYLQAFDTTKKGLVHRLSVVQKYDMVQRTNSLGRICPVCVILYAYHTKHKSRVG